MLKIFLHKKDRRKITFLCELFQIKLESRNNIFLNFSGLLAIILLSLELAIEIC